MMKILILNWRDVKNPQGGGAELLTHEMARRWAQWGHQVTQISAHFPQGQKREIIDGVEIIRLGRWWNVQILAFFYYLINLRGKVDIVIDEVHWFPFFSALYARKKTVLLVCEVANKLFFQVFPYPLAIIGRFVEKFYLSLYQNIPTLAISASTQNDLINEGFKKENITVIPMGITAPAHLKNYPKEKQPTLIFLGRLNKQKGIEDVVAAFKLIKKKISQCQLWIVGPGKTEYVEKIKQRVANLGLTEVKFFGFVSEEEKFKLLAKAHLLLVPSIHEGWGLIVAEAELVGTPAVGYNVAGLKDIIENEVSGILIPPKVTMIAKKVKLLFEDQKKYHRLQEGTLKRAKNYSWDKTAKKALGVISNV